MAVLGRDAFEARASAAPLEVKVDAWGGTILLRKLTATEATRYMSMASSVVENNRITDPDRMVRMLAMGIVWSWVDEAGEQVLTNADVDRLCKEPYDVLDSISDALRAFNGLTKGAEATAVAEAKKSSETTESDDFGTF